MNTQKETPLLTIVGQGDTTQVGTIPVVLPFSKRAEGIPYPIFPCRRYAEGDYKDKAPLTESGFQDATTDADTINTWSKRWPDALIGVPTGAISGIDVIDIDVEVDKTTGKLVKDGHSSLKAAGITLPATRVHKTARGGEHHLFKSSGLKNSASKVAKDVDVRGAGGYIIWWPAKGWR